MFLHVLDEGEQQLFAEAALIIVHADDHVDPRESALLDTLRIEIGMDELPQVPDDLDDVLARFRNVSSPVVGRVMLFELSGVVTADEHVHQDEQELLGRIAGVLEVPGEELYRFLEYALRAHSFWREARDLIAGQSTQSSAWR